jgi:mRNA-degrading endonuclease RelE of RelBE toxin-antitoxin system
MHSNYEIFDTSPEYQNALQNLPKDISEELQIILKILEDDPFPSITKQLRPPLQGRYCIRIDGYRLIYRVNLNSHRIFLLSIEPRAIVYI